MGTGPDKGAETAIRVHGIFLRPTLMHGAVAISTQRNQILLGIIPAPTAKCRYYRQERAHEAALLAILRLGKKTGAQLGAHTPNVSECGSSEGSTAVLTQIRIPLGKRGASQPERGNEPVALIRSWYRADEALLVGLPGTRVVHLAQQVWPGLARSQRDRRPLESSRCKSSQQRERGRRAYVPSRRGRG